MPFGTISSRSRLAPINSRDESRKVGAACHTHAFPITWTGFDQPGYTDDGVDFTYIPTIKDSGFVRFDDASELRGIVVNHSFLMWYARYQAAL